MISGGPGKDWESLCNGRIGFSFFLPRAALMRSIREPSGRSGSSVGDDCGRKLCHHGPGAFCVLAMNQVGFSTGLARDALSSSTFCFLFLMTDKTMPMITATRMTAAVIATAMNLVLVCWSCSNSGLQRKMNIHIKGRIILRT